MQGVKEVNAFDNIFPNADKISIDSKSGEPYSMDFESDEQTKMSPEIKRKITEKFKNANLTDDILFTICMNNKEFCKRVLSIILETEFVDIQQNRVQSVYQNLPGFKSARLDVYAVAADKTIYNVEMQTSNNDDMPKRSRFYQGVLDVNNLISGKSSKYANLPNSYVIFITEFDVFKNIGRYKYTFRNTCDEIPGLALGDGATKIFLNTKGTVRDKESDLLINFLHYVNESTMEKALADRKLIELHEILESVKGDSKSMGDYVNTEWARIEGEEKGEKKLLALIKFLQRDHRVNELQAILSGDGIVKQQLYEEYNIDSVIEER